MPVALPIIGAIAAAAGAGTSIYEAVNQPSAPKAPTGPQPLNPSQQNNVRAAVATAAPDIQSQLGGSVSPDYYLQNSQLISGTGNAPGSGGIAQSVINQLFGQNGGTSSTPANPGPSTANSFAPAGVTANPSSNFVQSGISDLYQQFFGGQ